MIAKPINILVVDNQNNRINRIREACRAYHEIEGVATAATIAAAHRKLNLEKYQIVFGADFVFNNQQEAFLTKAKESPGGQNAAYVAISKSSESSKQSCLADVLSGVDAVLVEPFSLNNFRDVLQLAQDIAREKEESYFKKLIEIALVDLITYIDASALSKKRKKHMRTSKAARTRLQETMASCVNNYPDLYFATLIEKLINLPPIKEQETGYTGASKRVREMALKKKVEELLDQPENLPAEDAE